MRDISVRLDGDEYHLRNRGFVFEVERVGEAPFKQAYEDPGEASAFFTECVGAAYLREHAPAFAEWVDARLRARTAPASVVG